MRRRPAVVLVAAALVAGACSGGEQVAPAPPATTAVTTSTTTTTAAPPPTTAATTAAPTSRAPTPSRPSPSPPPPPPALACPPVPDRPPPPEDRPRYVLRADVKPVENVVEGDVNVRFTPDLATDRLVFRLWPNAPRTARAGARLDAGPVLVGGHPAEAVQPDPTTLVVRLPGGHPAGRAVAATVPFRLTLPGPVADRVSRTGDAIRLGSFFPILAWEPGVGWATEPPTSAFAEASTAPAADFAASIGVPAGFDVLATGTPDGSGRWYATGAPDFAVSVGHFTTATATVRLPQPVQVTVGVHAGIVESPATYLSRVTRSLEDFSRRYGPYPWPSYSVAITPDLRGGIEYPVHVLQGPGSASRTTPHEVAHMWFYGLVGNNQGRDPWLDEGLATWAEARFEGTLATFRARAVPPEGRGRAGEPMTFWEARQGAYYRSVYVQGAQALAALGDAGLVDCALRLYVARTAYRVARPRDLVEAARAVFPDAPATLARFGIRA